MGRKARFKKIKNSDPEMFGFIEEDLDPQETVADSIYEDDRREKMLDDGEISLEEYGFMTGWDEAFDENSIS